MIPDDYHPRLEHFRTIQSYAPPVLAILALISSIDPATKRVSAKTLRAELKRQLQEGLLQIRTRKPQPVAKARVVRQTRQLIRVLAQWDGAHPFLEACRSFVVTHETLRKAPIKIEQRISE